MASVFTPFDRVLDYRNYRLSNRRSTLTATKAMEFYVCKQRIDGLHPTLGTFKGTPAIKLLSFLPSLIDDLNVTGASESTEMKLVAYYLDGEALNVNEEQLSTVEDDPEEKFYGERTLCAWPHVV